MFTGLVEDCGTIIRLNRSATSAQMTVKTTLPTVELRIGDSVSVSGACLTVVSSDSSSFTVDMSPETFERTTFSEMTVGSRVNLERALKMGDRLGGHIVTGHVDVVGVLSSVSKKANAVILDVGVPDAFRHYLVPKGSVAIDGISLTVNEVDDAGFSVSIIPHTLTATTLSDCCTGAKVNIETDILGKYVERMLARREAPAAASKLSSEFLAKHGFI